MAVPHHAAEPDRARTVLEAFVPSGRPVLVLATKADKLGTAAQRVALRTLQTAVHAAFPLGSPNVQVLLFSAVTRLGVAEAERIIDGWLPPVPAVAPSPTR